MLMCLVFLNPERNANDVGPRLSAKVPTKSKNSIQSFFLPPNVHHRMLLRIESAIPATERKTPKTQKFFYFVVCLKAWQNFGSFV